ncbi:MAG: endo alpha-1,4 polygalactosaminidase [Pseudomonadota bacterium]
MYLTFKKVLLLSLTILSYSETFAANGGQHNGNPDVYEQYQQRAYREKHGWHRRHKHWHHKRHSKDSQTSSNPYQCLHMNIASHACEYSSDDSSQSTPTTPANPVTPLSPSGVWKKANLTNYTSYPEPGSEECVAYSGCEYSGMFSFIDGKQTESWVQTNNIVAVHSKDADAYKLKTLRLRSGAREIDVKVYDMCADSDCGGCCTQNANAGGIGFLIDIEKSTMERFGVGEGVVEWQCLDCVSAPSNPVSPGSSTPVSASPQTPSGSWYKPQAGLTWQWQLQGKINTSYKVALYDIDLFAAAAGGEQAGIIQTLHSLGSKVICYFSAGSYEAGRPDSNQFLASDKGTKMEGWDELWLDIRSQNVRNIMAARLQLAQQSGCDGVEPDNVDGYTNKNGVGLTSADQLNYNQFLADEAHKKGLAIGLKNDVDQISQLVNYFDFAVNEQCFQYSECDGYSSFIQQGKPVLNAEYQAYTSQICTTSNNMGLSTLFLPLMLNDTSRKSCR